ncbi:GNAT family N-acetyltransferase [Kribbella catacumbae]|uniref:GNAT family N-acetyltransferase n=1 Tax=Kribbella catacumbae TaxID=460086 RepID=UPI0012FB05F9|nr:GNAT family N-acetyltransferase [Kribbella catacumbae]
MTRSHLAGVLDVINADVLPGQASCSASSLLRATTSGGAFVAIGDRILGAAGVGRSRDGAAGVVRWLHGREEPGVVAGLLDHALTRLDGCDVVEAFTGGGVGAVAAGLPEVRSTTREALVTRGFAAMPAGRYLYRSMPLAPASLPGQPRIQVTARGGHRKLTVPGPVGGLLAEATVSVLAPEHGVLRWIEVDSGHRGAGLGTQLLNACLRYLHRLGVRHVTGLLDDHNLTADDGHGRIGAHMIFTRAGFVTGAQLATYTKVG